MSGTWDYVIVGAGSAGCVIAARLTEDPSCRVLLLEAGGTDRSALCKMPGMVSIIHMVPQVKKKFDWGYKTEPRQETLGRIIPYVRGKVLGGSSAINGMVFVRGNRANYDGWAADGCDGWAYDDVLPYFKRLEDFEDGESEYRGGSGPIKVSRADGISPVSEAFLHACAGTCGVDILDDYNAGTQEGAARFQLSSRDGLRYSTSEAYLHPNRKRPNLEVISRALVDKVVLEGSRAVGIAYRVGGTDHVARADAEVILCAGSVGTPPILLRSGIGPSLDLKALDVPAIADLPVGRNLQDHLFLPMSFVAPNGGHKGTAAHFFAGMMKEMIFGGTWFGRSVFDCVAFVKLDSAAPVPDLQIHVLPWCYPSPNRDDDTVRPTVDPRAALTVQPTLIYPQSRGEITLTSTDPAVAPRIDPHYLEAEADVTTLMDGIKLCREIMAHEAIRSEITCELHPGEDYMDTAAMRRELPNRVATVYHPIGTARMGTDERAVVDPQLRVRGIEGLRVADASIIPSIPGGNTNAACIMIGEKAADLIRGITAAQA